MARGKENKSPSLSLLQRKTWSEMDLILLSLCILSQTRCNWKKTAGKPEIKSVKWSFFWPLVNWPVMVDGAQIRFICCRRKGHHFLLFVFFISIFIFHTEFSSTKQRNLILHSMQDFANEVNIIEKWLKAILVSLMMLTLLAKRVSSLILNFGVYWIKFLCVAVFSFNKKIWIKHVRLNENNG